MKRFFIGIDLPSPSGRAGVCVLEGKRVAFADFLPFSSLMDFLMDWKRMGELVVGIDGPQGLSRERGKIRIADLILNTPVKCGFEIPPPSNPYSEFVSGSIQFFYSLHKNGFSIFSSSNLKSFDLLETYPHAVWIRLSKSPLRNKRTAMGKMERLNILKKIGIETKKLLNHDIIDAGACALTSLFAKNGNFMAIGMDFFEGEVVLREGWVILPFLRPLS